VEVAYDAASALERVDAGPADVALLDIGLPDIDGFELARRLHARHPAIRLIAVSGYGQAVDRQRSAAAGFLAHIVKPVDLALLDAALCEAPGRP
jgi:CheY-like chemotaxis protein